MRSLLQFVPGVLVIIGVAILHIRATLKRHHLSHFTSENASGKYENRLFTRVIGI